MRVFQNSRFYPSFRPRLEGLWGGARTFAERMEAYLATRDGSLHLLEPILDRAPEGFLANGDDAETQRMWARERGMADTASLQDILLAQIEEHRTEVFYNSAPATGFDSNIVQRLPGSVRRSIAWHASPLSGAEMVGYDLIVSNFPRLLRQFEAQGRRTAYFFPAHDPWIDGIAGGPRPVDVVFVGSYSRHHRRRAALVEALAEAGRKAEVRMHLNLGRWNPLAETPLGWFGPLKAHARPRSVRRVSRPPVFGADLYQALAGAKIAINGAIDMVGDERGNLRCFEALSCGAMLLSDDGIYPEGFEPGRTLATYSSVEEAVELTLRLLEQDAERERLAAAGVAMVRETYSKGRQWARFCELAA